MTVDLFSYTIVVTVQGMYSIGVHNSGVASVTILMKKHGIAGF